ncbi:MAG: sortase [Anaerolineaceae bacterium]|nr:sortase [Anaerolineaceae bacterium]
MSHRKIGQVIISLVIVLLIVSSNFNQVQARPLFAPIPSLEIYSPSNPFIGEDFTVELRFNNSGDTGYGPYIDLFLPLSGADGLNEVSPGTPGPNDGISFNNATFLGQTVTSQVISCPAGESIVHPLTNLTVACPPQPANLYAPFEWQMIVMTLPFGSYVSDQPDAVIQVDVNLSNYADLGVGLPIYAQSGFMFGADPLNNPSIDPAIIGTVVLTTPIPTPKLVTLQKTYNGPENETATGPNYPRRYTITATIADGQTVENLVVTDFLPNNIQFISLVSTSPAASNCSLPSTTTPGGNLSCTFASVTGSAIIVFEYYIPLRDTIGNYVLDPDSGDDVNSCNQVRADGDWDPLDPRDEGSTGNVNENPIGCEHTLQDKSIAIQKGVSVVGGGIPTPGKTLEYTLNFQISDYFAFEDVVISDIISDGQHFDPSFVPTLFVNGNGFSSPGDFHPDNFSVACNYSGALNDGINCTEIDPASDNGITTFSFEVSSELVSRSFDGKLVGGCVPPSGTGGSDPDCSSNDGPTFGTIVFRTTILENFVDDYPSGDPSVDQGDVLTNQVSVFGNLLLVTDVSTPTGQSESDGSSASVSIPYGNISKSIYALNGSTSLSSPVRIAPGDTVTYRVRYTLPTSDFEDLEVTDYLPLPIFTSTEVTNFNNIVCGIPTAGSSCYGVNDTYHLISGAVTPTVTSNSAANSVIWTYGNDDGIGRLSSEIDLLFTITVNNLPFADGLFLTNQAQVVEGSTNASGNNANNIIQVQLTQPVVGITKGVVWTNRTNDPLPVFSPTPVGPVSFDGNATCSARLGDLITSDGLIANPINSNVSNLDAGDSVMMAVILENTGRYDAFDVQVKDSLPAGMTFVSGSLCITNGAGANLPYTNITLTGGFFSDGIELDDNSTGALVRGKDSNDQNNPDGTNIAVITYLATMDSSVEAGESYTNTSTLFNFAGTNDGPDHTTTDLDEDAEVTIFDPTVSKSLTGTDRDFTTGNSVSIGEIIEYTVTVKLPEGITNAVVLTDQLDAGLVYIGCDSITPSSGISTDLSGGFSSACNDPTNPTVTNQGRSIIYTLGNLSNSDTDNSVDDTITFVYRAIVINSLGNNPGTNLNNDVTLAWDGGSASDSADNVSIVEPFLQVNKTANPATGVDAGDTITFNVAVSHTGQSGTDAFEAHIRDDLSALPFTITALNLPVTFTGATCGTPNVTNNSSGNVIDLVIDQLPLGCSATFSYTATINVSVRPAQVITNTANIDWTNLPNSISNPSPYNDLDCERSGDTAACGAEANDYRASDPATVTIKAASFTKTIIATGINNTNNNNLQAVIGETIDYRLVLTVPEGSIPNLNIRDTLDGGLAFVQCLNITTSAGLQTDLIGGFANACPIPPQLPAVNPTVSTNALSIRYNLGNVTNSNTDNAIAETITIEYRVVVLNVVGNQQGGVRNNSARPYTNNIGLTGAIQAPNITIIEPAPTVTKSATIGGDSIGLPGEPVIYTITIRNTSTPTTDAYDVWVNDPLPKVDPPGDPRSLITDPIISAVTGTNPANFSLSGSNASGWILNNVNSIDLLVGQTITITIQGPLLLVDPPAVSADQLIKNIVDMTWTSLPGSPGLISIYSSSSTERDGTGGVNDYATNDDADIRIENIVFSKQLIDQAGNVLTGQDVRIGETIKYRITFTLPRDVYLTNLTFTDTLDDGLAFAACSSITAEAGLVSSLTDGFDCSNATITVTNNGKNLGIGFGNVQNTNLNSPQSIILEYTAIVLNTTFNDRGDALNNQVIANFSVNAGTTTLNASAPNVTINEPTLSVLKGADPTTADAGDTITFTLTVTSQSGTNFNDAYDVGLEDVLPSGFTYVLGSFANTSGLAPTTAPAYDDGTRTFTAGWNVFPPGQTSTFTFQAIINASVVPNQVITNIVDLNWTSMPGTVSNPTPYNEFDCERTGNTGDCGGSANDYSDDDTASVTVDDVSFTKTLTGTSATHTSGNDLTIGEIASFALTITLPEGTIPSLTMIDQIPAGMAYVANSFSIDNSNFDGSYGAPVVTPLANTNGADGQDLVIEFGEVVTNATPGTVNNVLVINLQAVVLNVTGNQAGVNLINTSSYQIGSNPVIPSNPITMPIVEPVLSIVKSFDNTSAPFEAGDTVSYQLVITNTSGLTAFDVVISDYAYATVSNVQEVPSPDNLVGLQDLTIGNHVNFTVEEFPSGTSLTISYDVVLPETLQVGETVQNSASVSWTSLDGPDTNERTGTSGDPLNDYFDEDAKDFTTEQPTIEKTVNKTDATIGEVVRFTLTVNSPKGTIEDWVIIDTLPAGLIYAGAISETGFDFPVPVVSSPNDGSAAVTVTWTMADPSVITNNSMSISFDVIVADVSGNQNGDTPQNSVQMNYTDGNDQPQSDSDTTTFEIIEPDLEVSKSFLPNPAGLGQTVTYTIVVSHSSESTSTAFDVALEDLIPTGLSYIASSIGGSCTSGTLTPDDSGAPTLSWTVDQILLTDTCTLTYQVLVSANTLTQTLTNAVTGEYSSLPDTPAEEREYPLSTDVDLVTTGPDLRIVKSDGGITAIPGGTISYTLNYWNDGNGLATGVVITETVPAHTTFNATASSPGWSCANGATAGTPCTLTIGSIAAGGNGSVTFVVNVNSILPTEVTQTTNTAVIADDGTHGDDPTPGNNTSTDPTPLNAVPDMTITKTDADISTVPGGTIIYTLTYDNVGNQDATGVVVTETVPANTTFTTTGSSTGWSCDPDNSAGSACTYDLGDVPASDAPGTLTFAVVVDSPLAAGVTQIDNAVSIADDETNGEDPTPGNNRDDEVTPVDAEPDLTISKTDDGVSAMPGDTIVYEITYDNTGNQTATGVVITETVPDYTTFNATESETGWICADGAVVAGTTCTYTVGTLTVGGGDTILFAVNVINPVPAGVDQIDNLVSITDDGSNSGGVPKTDSDDEVTPLNAAPDMTITKVDDVDDSTTPGATIIYSLTYDNVGNQDATGVVVTETVPANTTFTTTGSSTGWSCDPDNSAGSACTYDLGDVPASDAPGTLNFAVVVDSPLAAGVTQIDNAVSIADDETNGEDPTPGNNSDDEATPVDAEPDLTISKTDDGVSAVPGGTIVYEITYDNTGNQTATGVVITETVPDYTTFNTTESETGWICADGAVVASTTCTYTVGTLTVGGGDTILFAVNVINPVPAGVDQIDNLVSITDDGNNSEEPITDSDDETTPLVAAPDIAVQKTNGINQTAPGATLIYTIIISNVGEQDATGVTVEDTIPTGTTFVDADNAGVFDESTGIIIWPVFDLAAGMSRTFTITLLVDNPLDPSIVSIVNSVVANDDGTNGEDPNEENNSDTDVDVVGLGYKQIIIGNLYNEDNPAPAPGSELTVRIGDVITYEVGLVVGVESILEDLVLTDVLDRGLAFVDCEIIADGLTEDPDHPFIQICNPNAQPPSMVVETEPLASPNPADPGRKLTLTFGTISNETQGEQFLIVRYRVKVLNSNENIRGLLLDNSAEWTWNGGDLALDAEDVNIVEPELVIEKSVNPQTALIGQDVTFTLKIRHSEKSDVNAYDVVLEDLIPTGLTYVPGSLTFVSGQAPTSLNDSLAPRLLVSWDVFRLTTQETELTYKAKVDRLRPGQSATNTATVEWSSLPDSLPVPQSPYNPELSTERTYIPGSDINVYGAASSAIVNVPELPATGFAPGVVTPLPQMPFSYQYAQTGGMMLNIPKLGLNTEIIGIPLQDGEWNLTWLGKQAGYLEGTTFPTWNGNSAITAHVSNSDGTPGVFAALGSLKWGDTIKIIAFGQTYTYSVRQTMQVFPNDTSIFESETNPWLTLITCRGYDALSDSYDYRIVVRAVLVDVSD